jgi:autotransporter translocation and assembly factor TamB
MSKWARRSLRITGWLLASVALLFAVVLLLIETSWGNNLLRTSAQSWLRKKLHTELSIGNLRLDGLSGISLYNVILKDQRKDTLLSFDTLSVSYSLGGLAAHKIIIPNIMLSGLHSEIIREATDTAYSFQFIINAFASGPDAEESTASKSWDIQIGNLSLSRTFFQWDDRLTGDYYKATLNDFLLPLKKTDLQAMAFQAGESRIDGLLADIRLGASNTAPNPEAEEGETSPLTLLADRLTLTDTRFSLASPPDGLDVRSTAKTLSLDRISYNLATSRATGGVFILHDHDTYVSYRSAQETKTVAPGKAERTGKTSFSLTLDSISIERNGIAIHDAAYPEQRKKEFDPRHLSLQELLVKASAIRYDSSGYAANVRQLSFHDQNGFTLRQLQANAFFSDTALMLGGLLLETSKNRVAGSARVTYASLDKIVSLPAQTRLNLAIAPSVIRLDELAYFAPSLTSNETLRSLSQKDIRFNLKAGGTLDQLVLSEYRIQTGGNLIRGSARVIHPTDPARLAGQVNLSELTTSRKDLQSLLPKGAIPDSAWRYVPEQLTVKGTLNGSAESIRSDLGLQSSYGNLTLKGSVDQPTDKANARYDLTVNTGGLALDRILGDTALGNVAGVFTVKGRGYDPETMQANVDASIQEATFQGYAYNGIDLHGSMDRGDIKATVSSLEPNLDLDADFAMHYGKKISDIKLVTDIRKLDLQALGFMDSAFSVHGRANINFPVLDSARLEGQAMLNDINIHFGEKKFSLDTVSVAAYMKLDSQFISLHSPLADIEMKGHFSLVAIPGAAQTIVDNWLVTTGELKTFPETLYAELEASVHVPDSLAPLVPGLKSVSPFIAYGGIDTRQNMLVFLSRVPSVEYRDYTLDSISLMLLQADTVESFKKTQFMVQLQHLQGPSFELHQSQFGGQINKGVVDSRLRLYDDKKNIRYLLPVTFVNDPDKPYIRLQDTILLNSTRWQVNPDNRVYVNPDRLQGSNLVLSQDKESIALKADPSAASGLPLTLELNAFKLESLTGIFIGESKLLTGTANGKARLNSMKPITFQADLGIDSLAIFGTRYGNLHSGVIAEANGNYNLDVSLKGEGNDFATKGSLNPSSGEMDLKVLMAPLNLEPLAPFLATYVDSVRGGLRGDLQIAGSFKKPMIEGKLSLDSSYLIVRQTGTPLYVPAAGLRFNGQQISFEGMTLLDSAGRPATITGSGKAENLTDITYDLKVQSDKFLVSGRKRYEEQLVSGPLYAGMLLTIKGDLDHANINGNVNISDSSQITYIYRPDDDAASGEGLIEFFDPLQKDSADTVLVKTGPARKQGFQLAVNSYIRLTPTSAVHVVLDELTGDQLTVKGNANLNFTMDPGGGMEMTGNYEVESGAYNLTIAGLLKKDFEIQKGSTITWSGDILKANTNLTALYKIRTDAEELMRDIESVPGSSKQKLDFEVYMMIKGELLKPAISFRLDMPSKEQSAFGGTVYTRIKQVNSIPSELNKQVMGLLALNSFIADNPFNSLTSGGGSFETQAFSTAGRLLTQELNDFLGSVIKDVDIDIGLDVRDDYTSGEAQRRSDLKVGFTKSLANNRLSIYVGNTFALEHHNQNTNAMAGLAGDVSIEYLLSTDGKYRLKGYRLTEENLTFNGMVVETGVTFVVVLEFNKFKNAFRTKKKKNIATP